MNTQDNSSRWSGVLIPLLVLLPLFATVSRIAFAAPILPGREERLRTLEKMKPGAEARLVWLRDHGARPQGAQIAEQDYHERYLQLTVDVTDTLGKSIKGNTTQILTSKVNPLSQVIMDLIQAMAVDTVKVNGQTALFNHANDQLLITLPTGVPLGQNVTIHIAYHGNPPQTGDGLYYDTHNGRPFVWNLSEPNMARQWWPCKDLPEDKFDSSMVRIIAPSWATATSNGMLASVTTVRPGTSMFTWREGHPITPYLVCCAYGNFSRVDDVWHIPGGNQQMPIQSYVFPEQVSNARIDFSIAPAALTAYATRFGPYPFQDEKYGITVFGWSGGMEHQTNTFYGWFLITGQHNYDWIYVHEMSHQWWGDNVTCDTWADTWLNEGFASWCEAVYYESQGGATAYQNFMNGTLGVSDPSGPIYNYPDTFNGNTVYNKGGWAVHMLRGVLGDSTFYAGLANYRGLYQGKSVTTAQFEAALEQTSGKDLSYFFNEWVYGINRPHYQVSSFTEPHGAGERAYNHLDQTQTDGTFFTMPVQIRATVGSTTQNLVLWNDQNHADLVTNFPTSGGLTVTVDPNSWILCAKTGGAYGLNLITTSLPTVPADTTVADTLIARGGITPYTWQALDPLPPLTALNPNTGIISGSPTVPGSYSFRIKVTDSSSPVKTDTQLITWTVLTGDTSVGPVAHNQGTVFQIKPNPSKLHLSYPFFSVKAAPAGPVEFRIFDLSGRTVRTSTVAGTNADRYWTWDGRDATGREVPTGLYWARATSNSGWSATSKVVLLP